jgi:TldD protein
MNTETASRLLQTGRDCGADFAELFVEETRASVLALKDQKIETATAGTDFGIGIRLIYGTQVLYCHSSDENEDTLHRMIRELAFGMKSTDALVGIYAPLNFKQVLNIHELKLDPRVIGQSAKLDLLRQSDIKARSVSSKISQVSVSAADVVSHIEIFNSEGLYVRDHRARTRYNLNVTAGDGEQKISAHEAPGALGGFEFLETIVVDDIAVKTAERALSMLGAGYIEGRKMPVVMGNGFGGVIFHEACGHPLETESVRRKASPFCDKLDQPIAHEKVTAIDDGTLAGVWGSLNIDDEGMATQKTVLIEKGILKNYMSDRVGAQEVGVPRTGSARRESYKYAPVSRMRNSYIDAGIDSFEDMITKANNGLFAKKMGGGSVNPATGEFNFAVEEGYEIKNGKIIRPVRGATLIGKGHEILPRISMVGADAEKAAGMCGASSGSVPVTVGQPTLLVDEILVGGR